MPTAVVATDTGAGAAVRLVVAKSNEPVPPSVVLAMRTRAGAGVLANVHVMLSPACGTRAKLVPPPAGSGVVDVPRALLQEIELVYWPSVATEPPAIDSLSV